MKDKTSKMWGILVHLSYNMWWNIDADVLVFDDDDKFIDSCNRRIEACQEQIEEAKEREERKISLSEKVKSWKDENLISF